MRTTPELEAMAKAHFEAFEKGWIASPSGGWHMSSWETMGEGRQGERIAAMRAALATVLEPTEEMVMAGLVQQGECTDGGSAVAACVAEHVWQAMLNTALGEPKTC